MSRKALIVIIFLAFIDMMAFGIVYPLFSSMLFQNGQFHFVSEDTPEWVRGLWMGTLLSAAPVVQLLCSPFVGNLSDKVGRRPVILGCLSFGVVASIISVISIHLESLPLLVCARILTGVCISSFAVANACIADVSSQGDKGQWYSYLSTAFGLGFALGPLLGGLFSQETSFWKESLARPFYACSFLIWTNALMVYFWLPETYSPVFYEKEKKEPLFPYIKGVFSKNPSLGYVFIAAFLYCFGWSFYVDFIPVWWVKTFHMSTSSVGRFFAYGAIWYMLFCGCIVGTVSKRVKIMYLLFASTIVYTVSVWILFVINTEKVYWLLIPIQNIAAAFFFPLAATAASESASKEHQGRTMGIYASFESLGTGIAPVVSGPLLGVSLLSPVAIGGLAVFLASIMVYKAMAKKQCASKAFTL